MKIPSRLLGLLVVGVAAAPLMVGCAGQVTSDETEPETETAEGPLVGSEPTSPSPETPDAAPPPSPETSDAAPPSSPDEPDAAPPPSPEEPDGGWDDPCPPCGMG